MAMTFMACPEEMETERDFIGVLERVRSWKILGNHLELIDGSGTLLARLEAGAPK
jgi:heat shock protein HslJ